MSNQQNVTFQEALDTVEALPEDQQEDLIDLIRRRLIEQKREILAKDIKKARKEYAAGKIKEGTVDDLIKEISE